MSPVNQVMKEPAMKPHLVSKSFLSLSASILLVAGCTAVSSDDPDSVQDVTASGDGDSASTNGDDDLPTTGDGDSTGDGDMPDTGDGDGDAGDGDGDTGDGDGDSTTPEIAVFLPFNVTDVFAPSGFMGAQNDLVGETNESEGIVMDVAGCEATDRPTDAAGECFAVNYTPQYLTPCSPAELESNPGCPGGTWAGVFFQNPTLNWGEMPGAAVEPGATKIVFTAWTDGEALDLNFLAGGIGTLGTAYSDTFRVESATSINGTPTQYELDLTGSEYVEVIGGFGWTVEVHSLDPVVFYLDDIRWVTE